MKTRNIQSLVRKAQSSLGTILKAALLVALLAMLPACKPGSGSNVKMNSSNLPATGSQGVTMGGPQALQPDCGLTACASSKAPVPENVAVQPEASEKDQPTCQSLPYGSSETILHIQCREASQ